MMKTTTYLPTTNQESFFFGQELKRKFQEIENNLHLDYNNSMNNKPRSNFFKFGSNEAVFNGSSSSDEFLDSNCSLTFSNDEGSQKLFETLEKLDLLLKEEQNGSFSFTPFSETENSENEKEKEEEETFKRTIKNLHNYQKNLPARSLNRPQNKKNKTKMKKEHFLRDYSVGNEKLENLIQSNNFSNYEELQKQKQSTENSEHNNQFTSQFEIPNYLSDSDRHSSTEEENAQNSKESVSQKSNTIDQFESLEQKLARFSEQEEKDQEVEKEKKTPLLLTPEKVGWIPKTIGGMVLDEDKFEWIGNDDEIQEFEECLKQKETGDFDNNINEKCLPTLIPNIQGEMTFTIYNGMEFDKNLNMWVGNDEEIDWGDGLEENQFLENIMNEKENNPRYSINDTFTVTKKKQSIFESCENKHNSLFNGWDLQKSKNNSKPIDIRNISLVWKIKKSKQL
ncbi:hypothetical protein M0813_29379 [Anaeramoeba flamelloides]|uniref:Uncharacterized protein n=1 Tax=Anaeramoeba flamelloides TaxID=1746091 RepID=A0ABQ8XSP4_9EUKA|nr:hypothetical protein M0813_29379 [Anaeramoeba flamelloides]